jgi:hypothetical protein
MEGSPVLRRPRRGDVMDHAERTLPTRDHAAAPPWSGGQQPFVGGGEMGQLMREMDWSQTPLGPVQEWPQPLLTTVSLCLASRSPIVLW